MKKREFSGKAADALKLRAAQLDKRRKLSLNHSEEMEPAPKAQAKAEPAPKAQAKAAAEKSACSASCAKPEKSPHPKE